jgi:hypothetical protein
MMNTEQRGLSHHIGRCPVCCQLPMHGLGDDEAEVMCETVGQAMTPMFTGVGIAEHRSYPDLAAVADLDRANRHVISPEIEGTTAGHVEAGMMPMAGQDSIFDGATIERKPHVGAPIVERKYVFVLVHEKDWAMAAAHDEPTLSL